MPQQTLRIEPRQHQTLTPRLQQAVRLLQLSSLDFAQEVQQALDSNPFLEEDMEAPAPAASAACGGAVGRRSPHVGGCRAGAVGDRQLDIACGRRARAVRPKATSPWWSSWRPACRCASTCTAQLNVMPLLERDRALAALIVESLDDDGYLRIELSRTAAAGGARARGRRWTN